MYNVSYRNGPLSDTQELVFAFYLQFEQWFMQFLCLDLCAEYVALCSRPFCQYFVAINPEMWALSNFCVCICMYAHLESIFNVLLELGIAGLSRMQYEKRSNVVGN